MMLLGTQMTRARPRRAGGLWRDLTSKRVVVGNEADGGLPMALVPSAPFLFM